VKTFKFLLLIALFALAGPAWGQSQAAPEPHVDLIVIDGTINPAVDDFIRESIGRAKSNGARALLIQLDTPGGLVDSTRTIVKDMLAAPVPIIVYVAPSGARAGSAGVFITLAAHVAAMAQATNIGAAHPVAGTGEEVKGAMGEKIVNDMAAFSEAIAQRRGRNAEWAIEAVRKSVSITATEALKKNVIDIIAKDVNHLLAQAHGREVDLNGQKHELSLNSARIVQHEMSLKQKVLNSIAHPNIAYLLMMAGILGLYMEFSHPGTIFPGVTGAICLLLSFASLQLLPLNYTGLALMFLGVALLIAEAFLPSFGVLGIGGIISLALGSLLLFDTPTSDFAVDRSIVFTAVATLGIFVFAISYLVVRSQTAAPTLGMEGLIGKIGEARSRLSPNGKVFVHGEYWNAQGDGEIDPGERVKVVGYDGMRLKVIRLSEGHTKS
jgi:membrane-bound serine protease (ClpP class)